MIMPLSVVPGFLFYCYITAITPGPANLCSLSTAIQFGKKQALKQWVGLYFGFMIDSLMAVFVSYFLGAVIGEYVKYLAIVGALYLIYIAWKMLKSTYDGDITQQKKPGFWRGILVQLTNVKVMMSCFTELTTFVLPYNQKFWVLFLVGILLTLTGPIANLVWLFAGVGLRKFFINYTKQVNIVLAVSLLICAVTLILSGF